MYVEVLVNGRRGNAMIDTGATHNFISQEEARRLGLKPIQEGSSMKAVSSAAKPVHGVARNIPTKLGDWSGNLDFTVATMDDFNLVLGMDFLRASKAVPMPHLGSVLVAGQQPCLLKTCKMRKRSKGPLLSAMQLKKGLKRNEPTFLATLSVKEDEAPYEIPAALDKFLTEFEDLLPKELPKVLPPRRAVDHEIELETLEFKPFLGFISMKWVLKLGKLQFLVVPVLPRIPIIFEGDLAITAATRLKENDNVHIAGHLSSDHMPINLTDYQSKVQVIGLKDHEMI
uniref:Aspartic peptidase DDI1-type domain-containing protein n=1 Tax=Chenopodium quinoa TaxID=63459 RepID=A0A803MPQ4_CHEQI